MQFIPFIPNLFCFAGSVVLKFVIEDKKTITYVAHESEDGLWQFFSSDKFDDFEKVARVVGLQEIIAIDSTLKDIMDMNEGYCATRKSKNDNWIINRIE